MRRSETSLLRSQLFHPTFLWFRERFPSLITSNCPLIFLCVLVAIDKMTDVLSGESVRDLFQGFLKKHSPDSFISIKFGQNGGTTLNMVAESKEVADFWVRGLRKLILNRGLFISNMQTFLEYANNILTYGGEREKCSPPRVAFSRVG